MYTFSGVDDRAYSDLFFQTARVYITLSPICFVRFPPRFSTPTVDKVVHDFFATPSRLAFTSLHEEIEHVLFGKIRLRWE